MLRSNVGAGSIRRMQQMQHRGTAAAPRLFCQTYHLSTFHLFNPAGGGTPSSSKQLCNLQGASVVGAPVIAET